MYSFRTPSAEGTGSSAPGWSLPIPRTVAFLVIAALAVLFLLRHLFGSISISAGTK